jgi:hypothetical protein
VVNFGHYKVVGDNVLTHSQETISMARTIMSMVKAAIVGGNTMENIDDFDIDLH